MAKQENEEMQLGDSVGTPGWLYYLTLEIIKGSCFQLPIFIQYIIYTLIPDILIPA